jgi:hypothetical protein
MNSKAVLIFPDGKVRFQRWSSYDFEMTVRDYEPSSRWLKKLVQICNDWNCSIYDDTWLSVFYYPEFYVRLVVHG